MEAAPKEARGFCILAIAAVFKAANIIKGQPAGANDVVDQAETLVKEVEGRGLVAFEKE